MNKKLLPPTSFWALSLLLLLLSSLGSAWAQAPANDDPCGAVVLLPNGTLCTTPTTSTNAGATTTTPNGYTNPGFVNAGFSSCGQAASPKDVWFRFTTTATGASSFGVTVTVTGNPAGALKLYSAASCAGPFTLLECAAAMTSNSVSARLTTGLLLANTTYYIQVAGYGSNDVTGPFTICLTDGPGVPTCGSPQVGPYTSTGAGTGTVAFVPGQNSAGPYTYTLRNNVTGSVTGPFTVSTSPVLLTGLVDGHGYTLTLTNTCPAGGQSSTPYTFAVAVSNDDPCGAINLPVSATCVPTTGNNANATRSSVSTNGQANCAPNAGSNDVWYTFTTAAGGTGSTGVTVTPGPGGGAGTVRVYRAASCAGPFTQLGCETTTAQNGSGTAGPLVVNGLAPGTTYYVRVNPGGFFGPGMAGGFTICVVGAAGCAAPSALFAGITTATTAPLFFTAGNNNQSYTITYTAVGGPAQTATTTTAGYTLTGLLPGTRYTVSVVASCGGGQLSLPVTASFFTRIDNDEPCGALPVPLDLGGTCATPTVGSTLGATATAPFGYTGPGCGNSSSSDPDDVWFTFVTRASGPGSTDVELTLAGLYKQLRVFSAASCAGPFTELGCAGINPPSQTSPLPLAVRGLTPGTTYFVRVARLSNPLNPDPSAFTLCARPAPTCAPATALAVNAANSLSFGAGFGAATYVVTYQTAGGAVQTVTPAPTASPVTLSGLTPGLLYTATVQASCGGGQVAAPVSVTFVAGGCASRAYAPLPFAETFEATWLDVCSVRDAPGAYWRGTPATGNTAWRRYDDGAAAGWSNPTSGSYSPAGAQGSAYSARFHSTFFSAVLVGSLDLLVDLSGPGSKRLTFDYSNPDGPDSLRVLLSVDGGTTFQPLLALGNAPTFTAQLVDFAATSATAIIRFRGTTRPAANTSDLGLDNVQVLLAPVCAAPTALLATATATTASVSFTAPATGSPVASYTLTATPSGGAPPVVVTGSASPLSLAGLQPGTTYALSLVSNCGAGATSAAATGSLATVALPCPVPTGVSLGGISSTGATVSFTGGSLPTGYTVTATPPNGGPVVVSGAASPLVLTGLVPGTTYTVSVRANCPGGAVSATSASLTLTTPLAPCAAPTNVAVSALTPTSASASFTPTPGATAYTLTVTPTAGGPALTVSALASPATLPVLSPNTAYTVCVVATCAPGNQSASSCASFRTPLAVRNADLAARITLAPNPAHATATLTLPASLARQAVTVTLCNALGQVVREYPAISSSGRAELDLAGLAAGVYTVRLLTEQGPVSKRLLVE